MLKIEYYKLKTQSHSGNTYVLIRLHRRIRLIPFVQYPALKMLVESGAYHISLRILHMCKKVRMEWCLLSTEHSTTCNQHVPILNLFFFVCLTHPHFIKIKLHIWHVIGSCYLVGYKWSNNPCNEYKKWYVILREYQSTITHLACSPLRSHRIGYLYDWRSHRCQKQICMCSKAARI